MLSVLNRSCSCFVAPKQGLDSGPKKGATVLKLVAQLPNLWPQFWTHGMCVLRFTKSALSCDRLHRSFMVSCAWCQDAGFTVSRICAAVSLQRSNILAARIETLLFVFCGPKIGARFWTQKGGHSTEMSGPASKFVTPILDPWYMCFAFYKERLELRQVAPFIHVFMHLVQGCWFHMQVMFHS